MKVKVIPVGTERSKALGCSEGLILALWARTFWGNIDSELQYREICPFNVFQQLPYRVIQTHTYSSDANSYPCSIQNIPALCSCSILYSPHSFRGTDYLVSVLSCGRLVWSSVFSDTFDVPFGLGSSATDSSASCSAGATDSVPAAFSAGGADSVAA